MEKEATQSGLHVHYGIIVCKGHMIIFVWILLCPAQRKYALLREGEPFEIEMVKTHFKPDFIACYSASSITCSEMRCIKLVSHPENIAHLKYENKLAHEILNWMKLKKTLKDMEISSQVGLCVKDFMIIYQ